LVFDVIYSSTLKKEAISSSETSVHIHPNAQRCIPRGRTLHYALKNCFKTLAPELSVVTGNLKPGFTDAATQNLVFGGDGDQFLS
jgi:hypothetical protein